jgi:hypothetical protein
MLWVCNFCNAGSESQSLTSRPNTGRWLMLRIPNAQFILIFLFEARCNFLPQQPTTSYCRKLRDWGLASCCVTQGLHLAPYNHHATPHSYTTHCFPSWRTQEIFHRRRAETASTVTALWLALGVSHLNLAICLIAIKPLVPASNERMLQKSLTSKSDALIYDLEDSVAPNEKSRARSSLLDFLRVGTIPILSSDH